MRSPAPVTCVIVSHNNANTISAAIESVIRQTRPVSEIIIADDASVDESPSLIEAAARQYEIVRPVLRRENLGVGANRDLALRAASQPFVTHLDGDDLFGPRKSEAEWAALDGAQDCVACSWIAMIRPEHFLRGRLYDPRPCVSADPPVNLRHMLMRTWPIPRDILMSKRLYEQVGGFNHATELYEDWDFKLRLAASGVPWIASNAVGTLYLQWGTGLSAADSLVHDRGRQFVVERLRSRLSPLVGDDLMERAKRAQPDFGPSLRRTARLRFWRHIGEVQRAYRLLSS